MEQMQLAIATDDGEHFMGRHFGDAKFFEIYEFSGSGYEIVGRVINFVCVLTGHDKISDGLDLLVRDYLEITTEFEKGGERGFLDWRDR